MKPRSQNSLTKNYFLNLGYQILISVLPLVTAPYLARVLEPDRIGEYSFAQSITSYFALFAALGTSLYGQRAIAAREARGEDQRQFFAELALLRAVCTALALGVYFAVILPLSENPLLTTVLAAQVLAVAFDVSWFFQGVERFQVITLCSGAARTLGAAAIFLFVKSRADLEKYALIIWGAALLGNAVQWAFLPALLRGDRLTRPDVARHLAPALKLFISLAAIQAYTVLDRTMIGLITRSDFENGYYDQAQTLITTLVALVTSFSAVMASRVTILLHSEETPGRQPVRELILFSFRLVFALGLPIMAGVMLIAARFVPVYLGPDYGPVAPLLRVLSAIVPIIGCSNVAGMQLLVPSGRERLLTRSVIVGALVNVALNALLIPRFRAMGAASASVLAELTVTGVQLYFVRREIPIRRVLRLLARYALLAGAMALAGGALCAVLGAGPWAMLGIMAACAVVYLALLLGLKDPVLAIFSM